MAGRGWRARLWIPRVALECRDHDEQARLWLLLDDGRVLAFRLAGATPYLRLFARASGGAYLAKQALAARLERAAGGTDPRLAARYRRLADQLVSAEVASPS